ncbi:TonB-dependent receptor [Undibacterium jejuense]|uniref:TonB-dependent receptor n=1 Tax=Undibacterium jejuense TaxID=1344949 RepID=A0A923KI43_9BURK|nr:TonB-dependent receptor [Undibacterium jejuense]MBC3862017.1 TonB-dependent receptor [Undibacterium jejuense]
MVEKILAKSVRLMFVGGVAFAAIGQVAVAQEATPGTNAQAVQRVEITGSSIKRAEKEGALPVQVVTHEDILKTGATSTEQLLNTLSINSAVGGTTTAQGTGSTTYGLASASLRALGANKTLILVNGRRVANYASDGTTVDINSIPVSMIDHVEILKDGASGVYGSDAIGGVINFITRKNFSGIELTGTFGGTSDGGGQSSKAGIVAGFGDFEKDRYNITVSLDASKEKAIYGSQRSYAQHSWDDVNGLWDTSATPSGRINTIPGSPAPNTIPPYSINTGVSQDNPLAVGGLAGNTCAQNGSSWNVAEATCRYNPSPLVPLVPDVDRTNLGANFRFKLSDDHEFFIDGFFAHAVTTVTEQASPYSSAFLYPDTLFVKNNVYPGIILSPTSPYYPTSYLAGLGISGPVSVSYRAFDGGGRVHSDTSNQIHFVTGLRGTIFQNYDYDIAYTHNSSTVSEATLGGYQQQFKMAQLLSNNPAFNPFTKTQTPALAAQIAALNYNGNMLDSSLGTDSLDGKISGDLFKMPAGMAQGAAGFSWRNENMNYNPSAAYQTGDISGYGNQVLPFNVSRHSASVFGELSVPLLKNLDASLAARTDRYPDATSTNPKISLSYHPISQVLLRASYGTGYRQPALPELYTPQAFSNTVTFTDPVAKIKGQFNQLTGGNLNLLPEKSKQFSLGIVADITKDLNVAVDYWNINIRNLITSYGAQAVVKGAAAGNPAYTGLVTRDASGNISQITLLNLNAGREKTDGVDIDLKWKVLKSPEYGTFGMRLNGTYTRGFEVTLPDGTVQPSVGKTVDADGNVLNAVTNGGIIFKWKHQLNFDWSNGAYGLTVTQNYQSGYDDNVPQGFSPITTAIPVSAFQTWDLQGTYTGLKNTTIRVGMKNFLNKMPPTAITGGQYFQSGYDPSYYDPHGRFGYVTANYKF